jgi:VCBS repeat-containing protein
MFDAAGAATVADVVAHDTGTDALFDTADSSVDQMLLGAAAAVSSTVNEAPTVSASSMSAGALAYDGMARDGVGSVDGLDGAYSVVISPDGRSAYAVGQNDDALTVFSRDTNTGALTRTAVFRDGVGGVNGFDGVRSVTVSADGKSVYALSEFDDTLTVFNRDTTTGALTYSAAFRDGIGGVDGLDSARQVTVSSDGKSVYAVGWIDNALAVFNRNTTTGALTYAGVFRDGIGGVDGLLGAQSVTVSQDGKSVYVTGTYEDGLAVFNRNTTTGALTYAGAFKDGVGGVDGLDGVISTAVSADGRSLYAAGRDDNALAVFNRNTTTGALTYAGVLKDGVGGVDGLAGILSVTISSDDQSVYVAGMNDNALAVFNRNTTTGALTYAGVLKDGVGGVDGLAGAISVTMSPDDRSVYVASNADDAVAVFDRSTGSQSPTGTAAFTEGTPVTIAPSALLSDADGTTLSLLTITLDAAPDGTAESLAVAGTLSGGITTTGYDSATRTLTLTGTAGIADYQTALRRVQYSNSSDNPTTGNRTIAITATDSGEATGPAATVTVTVTGVNDAPVAGNDTGAAIETGGTANGTAGSNATGNVLSNDADPDGILTVTTVRTGATEGSGTAGTVGQALTGSYGALTLNADGSYSYVINNANTAVQALAPGQTLSESFNYTVGDSGGLTDSAVLTVTITGADDAPVLTVGAAPAFTAGSAAQVVAPALTVDGDNNLITDAKVTLTNPAAGDVLDFTALHGITGSYANGVLTLTGSATAAQWQEVLRTVTFQSPATTSAPDRSIRFDLGTRREHHYEYVEGAITWSNALTAAAGRQYNGMQGYLATVTSAQESARVDALVPTGKNAWIGATDEYTQINSAVGSTVYASQTASEGRWYWASGPEKGQQFWQGNASGSAVGGNYTNWSAGEPNNQGPEQYAHTHADGTWNDSYGDSFGYIVEYGGLSSDPGVTGQTVTLAVDNRPMAGNDTGAATEAGGTAGSNATGNVLSNDTDVDSTSRTVNAVRTGATEGSGTAGTVGQALTGSYGALTLNADGSYSYTVDDAHTAVQALAAGQTLSDSFNYTVGDGGGPTDTAVLTVTITGANDAPTIAFSPTAAFTEGTAVTIAPDAVLADVDSATLNSLIITLDAAPDGAAESLSVTGLPAGITTTGYDAATRTLTLTGAASVADYQAALRLVTYNNSSDNPTTTDRTVKFKATDSSNLTSSAAVVALTVSGVNDAPTQSANTGATVNEGGSSRFPRSNWASTTPNRRMVRSPTR